MGSHVCALILGYGFFAAAALGQRPAYLDRNRPVEERVKDLLSRMTLEEKIGQMNISWGGGYEATRKAIVSGEPERTGATKAASMAFGWGTDILAGPRRVAELDNPLKSLAVNGLRFRM